MVYLKPNKINSRILETDMGLLTLKTTKICYYPYGFIFKRGMAVNTPKKDRKDKISG